jgi:hypothetical protein
MSYKSTLNQVAQTVWGIRNLEEAKEAFITHVESTKIKDVDRLTMVNNVNGIRSKSKLDLYLANSLLKFEGLGVAI